MYGKSVSIIGIQLNSVSDPGKTHAITTAFMASVGSHMAGMSLPYPEEQRSYEFKNVQMVDPLHPSRAVKDVVEGYTLHGEELGHNMNNALYAFRCDTLSVPSADVNAEIERAIFKEYEAKGRHRPTFTKSEKSDFKNQAILRLIDQYPVKSKVVHAILHKPTGFLYLLTSSTAMAERVRGLINNYILYVEGEKAQYTAAFVAPWAMAGNLAKIDFYQVVNSTPSAVTAQFLTWLWFQHETRPEGAPGIDLRKYGVELSIAPCVYDLGDIVAFSETGNGKNVWSSTETGLDRLRYVMWKEEALLGSGEVNIATDLSYYGAVSMSWRHCWAMKVTPPAETVMQHGIDKGTLPGQLTKDPEGTRGLIGLQVDNIIACLHTTYAMMAAFLNLTRAVEDTSPRRWAVTVANIRNWLEAYVPPCEIDGSGVVD